MVVATEISCQSTTGKLCPRGGYPFAANPPTLHSSTQGPLKPSHAVICVSMKIRMRTRRAGTAAATIIQGGKGRALPRGGMNHVRLSGEVTESPVGTVSFCMARRKTGLRDTAHHARNSCSSCSHESVCPQYQGFRELGYEQVWGELVLNPPKPYKDPAEDRDLLPNSQSCQENCYGNTCHSAPNPLYAPSRSLD